MVRIISSHRLKLSATGRLLCKPIRECTAQSCRTNRLMAVYHNLISSSTFYHMDIVIVHPLRGMIFTTRDNISYITSLHRIISIIYHILESLFQLAFIISGISGCFMMHYNPYPFTGSIMVQFLHIKIRIRFGKKELTVFAVRSPIFPTFVPSLYQYSINAILCRKINIFFYMSSIGCMTTVRSYCRIVCNTRFGFIVITIRPSTTFSSKHFPPYAYEFLRFNPRSVF